MDKNETPRPIGMRTMQLFAMVAAIGAYGPQEDERIPVGWECTGCSQTREHAPNCKGPRGFKKLR